MELVTTLCHSLHAHPSDTDAATHREMLERKQVKANAAQGGIGNRRAAKRHVKIFQLRTLKGENLGSRVRQCAAERLTR